MCGFLLMKGLLTWKAAHQHSTRSPWTRVREAQGEQGEGLRVRLWRPVVGPVPHHPQRTISAQECLALMTAGFLPLEPGVSDKAACGGRVRLPLSINVMAHQGPLGDLILKEGIPEAGATVCLRPKYKRTD